MLVGMVGWFMEQGWGHAGRSTSYEIFILFYFIFVQDSPLRTALDKGRSRAGVVLERLNFFPCF